jgi:hypothetical protein
VLFLCNMRSLFACRSGEEVGVRECRVEGEVDICRIETGVGVNAVEDVRATKDGMGQRCIQYI